MTHANARLTPTARAELASGILDKLPARPRGEGLLKVKAIADRGEG